MKLNLLKLVLICFFLMVPFYPDSLAQNLQTLDALARLEEILTQKLEVSELSVAEHTPILVVETKPFYEESKAGFRGSVLKSFATAFPSTALRDCQRCVRPFVYNQPGRLIHSSGPLQYDELRQLDSEIMGEGKAAKSALWVQETRNGITVTLTNINTGQVLLAENVTPDLEWTQRSAANFSRAKILDMRIRGQRISHSFMDAGAGGGGHWGFDWSEQWGETNRNLTGFSLTLISPILGVGFNYARIFPGLWNSCFGSKFAISIPSLLVNNLSKGRTSQVIDPLVTLVGFARIPFTMRSNYGGFVFATSNASFGIGISTFNISLLPVVP